MNKYSATAPPRVLDRSTAYGCMAANLLVLPGLGTRVAGRRWGWTQMGLSLAGLTLSGGAFGIAAFELIRHRSEWAGQVSWMELGETLTALPVSWEPLVAAGVAGVILFLAGWVWALASSLTILRDASGNQKTQA